ncbi:hypothetical protein NLI96_g12490 [Meripilus lineatus]|uniref:Alpha-methylacyl-CoA racemase n=1 Tax=Meripilus lineatus TaxID=2056292 RepID=A0AAD5Y7I8_9APHY|nr:hypothetical protein NLI96_g12490 [Physisporinus lineatus]
MASKHPLEGLRVVEFAGLAPGPFAGLVLADWGANVIRIDRPTSSITPAVTQDYLARNKRSLAIDPKVPSGLATLKKLINNSDVLIDPFRPGVMERLGLGPDIFLGEKGSNKKLVYARLAGFSPTGRERNLAGHDINYIALSGVLSLLPGTSTEPSFPLNLLADFAGGGLLCALGILIALFERETKSGLGQVVQSDMVSGTRYISSFPLLQSITASATSSPLFSDVNASPASRMRNTLDGGAPFYAVYPCADDRWMSVGCLEPKFFAIFIEKFLKALPQDFTQGCHYWKPDLSKQNDRSQWPAMRVFFAKGFKTQSRAYWEKVFDGSDACTFPVLTPLESSKLSSSGSLTPAPHPNLERTPAIPLARSFESQPLGLKAPGEDTDAILCEIGLTEEERRRLRDDGALGKAIRVGTKL